MNEDQNVNQTGDPQSDFDILLDGLGFAGDTEETVITGGGGDIMKRIFEPFPADGMTRFKAGDKVRLVRRAWFLQDVPLGCEGEVVEVDPPDSVMSEKGRPYSVRFNLLPYEIPIDEKTRNLIIKAGIPADEIPPFHIAMTTNVSPLDIEKAILSGERATKPVSVVSEVLYDEAGEFSHRTSTTVYESEDEATEAVLALMRQDKHFEIIRANYLPKKSTLYNSAPPFMVLAWDDAEQSFNVVVASGLATYDEAVRRAYDEATYNPYPIAIYAGATLVASLLDGVLLRR